MSGILHMDRQDSHPLSHPEVRAVTALLAESCIKRHLLGKLAAALVCRLSAERNALLLQMQTSGAITGVSHRESALLDVVDDALTRSGYFNTR